MYGIQTALPSDLHYKIISHSDILAEVPWGHSLVWKITGQKIIINHRSKTQWPAPPATTATFIPADFITSAKHHFKYIHIVYVYTLPYFGIKSASDEMSSRQNHFMRSLTRSDNLILKFVCSVRSYILFHLLSAF